MSFTKKYFIFFFALLCLFSCKEETYIYEVNDVTIESNNSNKGKEKTPAQYLNILYANLYQKPLSPNQLVDLINLVNSIGDKQVAYETIIAKMMTDPDIQIPSKSSMNADVSGFVTDTYKRFYVRIPTEAEKTYFVNFIQSHPNIGPEHIYFSFATSNEYYFY